MKAKKTRFVAAGNVRGCCSHLHLTWEAAQKCADRDHRGCKTQGGYTDRAPHLASCPALFDKSQDLRSCQCEP